MSLFYSKPKLPEGVLRGVVRLDLRDADRLGDSSAPDETLVGATIAIQLDLDAGRFTFAKISTDWVLLTGSIARIDRKSLYAHAVVADAVVTTDTVPAELEGWWKALIEPAPEGGDWRLIALSRP